MSLQKDTLTFEKKNQSMARLPKCCFPPISQVQIHHPSTNIPSVYLLDARISKRPIPHAPTANPYAGASVPKTVYISTKTPFMSAVKRALKLLRQAEKRALDASGAMKAADRRNPASGVGNTDDKEKDRGEEVFVKATGRAIEKALSVGRWFERDEEKFCVRINTGSVLVVDDVEEDEETKRRVVEEGAKVQKSESESQGGEDGATSSSAPLSASVSASASTPAPSSAPSVSKSASRKRKRAACAAGESELPETRTRWVNMVEIAVSLK
ncbi:hypothetical protein PHISP_01722 [Aspergillus sp. HF37]|nr:hypothetical protein PHISP_01722 [Aspergillus sp. HF37]